MNLFGLTIQRTKAMPASLSSVGSRGGWWPAIRESFPGAWQRNITVDQQSVMTFGTVWACVTLIASDIAKLWLNLVEVDDDGIWSETENPAYSPVLRKPNRYQTRVKFYEYWLISKLVTGNTYALKVRDNRNVVTALHVLDPTRVQVLVAPDGAVFYQLSTDYLSGLDETSVTVPAREIIHDICVPLYHPLVGVSPIHACGLAAMQGLKIQHNSALFFGSGSNLSGVLTAPGTINDVTAKRLEAHWEANYAGEANVGKIAVLGDGLKFEPMTMTAVDAQLIDQLKWTGETVCQCYHVPGYMVGIGPPPPYTDIQSINLQYYTQALQNPIENLELLLNEGLELPKSYGVEFDLATLARMDTKTQMDIEARGVGAGIFSPNEARATFDRKPVKGGETPYLQQQNYSIEALAKRDAQEAPPKTPALPEPKPDEQQPEPPPVKSADFDRLVTVLQSVGEGLRLAHPFQSTAIEPAEPELDDDALVMAAADEFRKALAA